MRDAFFEPLRKAFEQSHAGAHLPTGGDAFDIGAQLSFATTQQSFYRRQFLEAVYSNENGADDDGGGGAECMKEAESMEADEFGGIAQEEMELDMLEAIDEVGQAHVQQTSVRSAVGASRRCYTHSHA